MLAHYRHVAALQLGGYISQINGLVGKGSDIIFAQHFMEVRAHREFRQFAQELVSVKQKADLNGSGVGPVSSEIASGGHQDEDGHLALERFGYVSRIRSKG